jgi:hypothetical protein
VYETDYSPTMGLGFIREIFEPPISWQAGTAGAPCTPRVPPESNTSDSKNCPGPTRGITSRARDALRTGEPLAPVHVAAQAGHVEPQMEAHGRATASFRGAGRRRTDRGQVGPRDSCAAVRPRRITVAAVNYLYDLFGSRGT